VTASTHPDRRVTAHGWLRAVQRRSTLTPKARAVAAALFARMDEDGTCWPSLATIATDAGYVRSHSVLAALDELEAAGWLLRERRRKANGAPATTRYAAVVPAESVDPADPVGPPAGHADGARKGHRKGSEGLPALVDNRDRGTPSHGAGITPRQGPELATVLPTEDQLLRTRTRGRREDRPRGRPPAPMPRWESVTSPEGRVYVREAKP
jgi:hypothetical protein